MVSGVTMSNAQHVLPSPQELQKPEVEPVQMLGQNVSVATSIMAQTSEEKYLKNIDQASAECGLNKTVDRVISKFTPENFKTLKSCISNNIFYDHIKNQEAEFVYGEDKITFKQHGTLIDKSKLLPALIKFQNEANIKIQLIKGETYQTSHIYVLKMLDK